jgi:hypothetical protein
MKRPDRTTSEFAMMLSTTQPIETKSRLADFVIGGLLVAFAIGGFAL